MAIAGHRAVRATMRAAFTRHYEKRDDREELCEVSDTGCNIGNGLRARSNAKGER
jgi:hypothetical protein